MAAHVLWVFRAEVNWDEFALLARAHESLAQGELLAGGRPGLSTLLLLPIVEGCENAVQAARTARLFWTVFSAGILVGFWLFLVRLLESRERPRRDALIGVALLALTPAFLRFSLQVRTDQPAIAFGLLAGAVLLASRDRVALAIPAGILFGLGFASSQKLLYVGALIAVAAVGHQFLNRDIRLKRDGWRVALAGLATIGTVVGFRALVAVFSEPAGVLNLSGQMNVFSYYRETIGYSHYVRMLPGLIVPLGLTLFTVILLPWAFLRGGRLRWLGLLSAAVLGLGVSVALFHAGALPYFWLTLGLFPATAVAVGLPVMTAAIGRKGTKRLLVFSMSLLLATAAIEGARLGGDGQKKQLADLAFIESNFADDAQGFHTTRALLCREGSDPFRTYFSQTIHFAFSGDGGEERAQEFIAEFRERPVSFILRSYRLQRFPESIRDFWAEHYVQYRGAVLVPGTEISVSGPGDFTVIVPGDYTVHADSPSASLLVDGRQVSVGERLELAVGTHRIALGETTDRAMLTLALREPPGGPLREFYSGF